MKRYLGTRILPVSSLSPPATCMRLCSGALSGLLPMHFRHFILVRGLVARQCAPFWGSHRTQRQTARCRHLQSGSMHPPSSNCAWQSLVLLAQASSISSFLSSAVGALPRIGDSLSLSFPRGRRDQTHDYHRFSPIISGWSVCAASTSTFPL